MNRINKILVRSCLFLCLTVANNFIFAQGYGKISGSVVDELTSEPLPFTNITIQESSLGSATDMDGKYIILKIPSGIYTVVAQYIGYNKVTVTNVEVLADLTTELNFKLQPSSVQLEGDIVITAQRNLVRKDITSTESRISAEDIEQLPVQEAAQIIDLQAGVSRDADGDLHIRGGRSTEISYLINGISITDDYSREQVIRVETSSIQELQVISGTFNAEYGNALSGVINYITKTGNNNFAGNIEMWTGDYISSSEDIFWGIDELTPVANYNLIGTFSGPIVPDLLTFFGSLRRYYNDGWIYGENVYSPQGRYTISGTDTIPNPGDNELVSMSYEDLWSGQFSLELKPITTINFKIDFFGSKTDSRSYDHNYRLNPWGDNNTIDKSYSIFPKITHTLSNTAFYELAYAYRLNETNSKLYDDPYDASYVHPDSANVPGFTFLRAGTDLNRFQRTTTSNIFKLDVTNQLNSVHLIKLGADYQLDNLFYENIDLVPLENENGQEVVPFQPSIRGTDTPQHDLFERNPIKFAAYIQDKIELESLILNIGLRFDLFDPQGKIPVDQSDPNIYSPFKLEHIYKDLNGDGDIGIDEQVESNEYTLEERESFWWNSTSVKTSLSPRIGLGYPITDQGTIRFSFGIFQQIPEYSQLYLDDQLKLTETQGTQGPFGNPDLKPQTTDIYEIGFKQMVTDNIAIDITGFYRDIRNWISTSQPIPTVLAGTSYVITVNKDLANIKGVTLAVTKRFSDHYAFDIDYTYQIAEGTNSAPDQEYFAQLDGNEPTKQMTPLDWDQTHTLNAAFYFGYESWGASITSKYNTGQPYTPEAIAGAYTGRNIITGLNENSRRKPSLFNIDFEIYKSFFIAESELLIFLRVFNLLDSRNPVTVFNDTGLPDYTLEEEQVQNEDEDWYVYPNYYSQPRSIYLGTKIKLGF